MRQLKGLKLGPSHPAKSGAKLRSLPIPFRHRMWRMHWTSAGSKGNIDYLNSIFSVVQITTHAIESLLENRYTNSLDGPDSMRPSSGRGLANFFNSLGHNEHTNTDDDVSNCIHVP